VPIELPTHKERKKLGNGRVNQTFHTHVPRNDDSDIQDLIRKFPVVSSAISFNDKKKAAPGAAGS